MKRIISLVLVMTMLLSMPVSTYADNIENKQPTSTYGDAMLEYLKTDNHKLLVVRGNYGYMQFADDFRQNVFSLYLLEMIDMLIETGTEPDQQKYMEVLINIIATYDLDNAADISEQNSMDNLKSLEEYAMDFVEMGANAVSVMVGNNPVATEFENNISTAIDRISVLKDNTNDWIEALSDLETIVQSYDKHDRFLELIENNAKGDLKIAASTLRMGMKKAFQIKLDTYADISDKNFENYSELFFEDVFWKALKEIPEYETDKSLKAFVDSGDSFVSKLDLLESSWELGLGIGKLVGNVTVGGEDLINRVMEILALYDISSILQLEVSDLSVQFFEDIGTEKEADIIEEYSALAQYLIGCRVRGEYCLYSIVANDAGLLSWFNKESAEEAKIWYEYKAEKILDIQAELLEVSQGNTVLVSDSDGELLTLSQEDQYSINTFLSNFSEQWFQESYVLNEKDNTWIFVPNKFDVKNSDVMEMINFAWLYANINTNETESVQYEDYWYTGVNISTIKSIVERFFGKTFNEEDIRTEEDKENLSDVTIVVDDKVCRLSGDGETYNHMSVVKNVYDLHNGTLQVNFNIYSINHEGIAPITGTIQDKSVYYFTDEQAKEHPFFEYHLSGMAVIEPYVSSNEKENYRLVSYELIQDYELAQEDSIKRTEIMDYYYLNTYEFAKMFDMQIKEGQGGCNGYGQGEYLYRHGEWASYYTISLHASKDYTDVAGGFQVSIISEKYSIYDVCIDILGKQGFVLDESETWNVEESYYYYLYDNSGSRIQLNIYEDICNGIEFWPSIYFH